MKTLSSTPPDLCIVVGTSRTSLETAQLRRLDVRFFPKLMWKIERPVGPR